MWKIIKNDKKNTSLKCLERDNRCSRYKRWRARLSIAAHIIQLKQCNSMHWHWTRPSKPIKNISAWIILTLIQFTLVNSIEVALHQIIAKTKHQLRHNSVSRIAIRLFNFLFALFRLLQWTIWKWCNHCVWRILVQFR